MLVILVSLEPPNTATILLNTTHIVTSKSKWLRSWNVKLDEPMTGLLRCLYLDNTCEFHSKALTLAEGNLFATYW